MTNHPQNLDIYDSAGPPAGIVPLLKAEHDAGKTLLNVKQDIATFGIAGRIWDSSYFLDVFLRRPSDRYAFFPPCPIPCKYFLPSAATATSTANIVLDPITIIELGAGTGYVGIALAKRLQSSCTLVLTDLEDVLPLLEKNVWENKLLLKPQDIQDSATFEPASFLTVSSTLEVSHAGAVVKVEPLSWGNSSHAAKFLSQGHVDYVIASDLVYFPELYPSLLQSLQEIADLETCVIFGYKERAAWKEMPFWEQFGRFFKIEVVQIQNKSMQHKDGEEGEEDVGSMSIFGSEEGAYVFVAKKRRDEDILSGVDDTLATLVMMQIEC